MPHDPKVLDHEYDGIQEFDNPTPGWWHFLFYLFIVFSFFYTVLAFAGSPYLKSPEDKHQIEKIAAQKKKFETLPDLQPDAMTIASYSKSDPWMDYAASVFAGNCVLCHGAEGGGAVGPNLTDEFGKSVKTIEDIHMVIQNGAAAGAMPAWGQRLHPKDVILLSSYVAKLRGTSPMVGIAPDGEQMEPWPDAPAPVEPEADSGDTGDG